jgi:hypothetical protein
VNRWRWIEAGVLTALVHQAVRAVNTAFILAPQYLERAQLWRFRGDRTFAWLPAVYLFVGFSLAYVYGKAQPVLGSSGWKRGVRFGFWVWLLAAVPYQGTRFVLMPIPAVMGVADLLGDLVAYLLSGIVLSWILDPRANGAGDLR